MACSVDPREQLGPTRRLSQSRVVSLRVLCLARLAMITPPMGLPLTFPLAGGTVVIPVHCGGSCPTREDRPAKLWYTVENRLDTKPPVTSLFTRGPASIAYRPYSR